MGPGKVALLLAGTCAGLLLLEGAARLLGPALLEYDGGPEHLLFHTPELLAAEYRARNACLTSDEVPAPASRQRVLFLGDSVTERGRIIRALRRRLGDQRYQWLNGGMAAYNTSQEVRLYATSCVRLRAQRVVLTIHNNDLETNRVMFQRGQEQTFVDRMGPTERWLVRHSHVHRLLLGRPGVVGQNPKTPAAWEAAAARLGRALQRLQRLVQANDASLSVVLLPPLRTPPRPAEARSHDLTLRVLRRLELQHFDLNSELLRAVRDGVTLHEAPGDVLHPSQALADRFAAWLLNKGLLKDP